MRRKTYKGRCEKRNLEKFTSICKTYDPIQSAYANILVKNKDIGQTDFSFAAVYGLAEKNTRHSKAYLEAAYPDVPARYTSKIPKDLVLGKHKGKYAYCPIGNPNKTSPAVLNVGKNLDLAIHESMLVTYQPFFRLVTMQILRHCESDFHEDDDRYTMLIFDEAARIGKINGLDAAMSTLRSKHTALICLFQSISQFKDIYPQEKAMTLLNLCELKLFLSGSGDKDSTDYVSGMVGSYDAIKMTYKRKGAFGGKCISTIIF